MALRSKRESRARYDADKGSEDFKDLAMELLTELEAICNETLTKFHQH